MKRILVCTILATFFALISMSTRAQIEFNRKQQFLIPDFTPKSFYNLDGLSRPLLIETSTAKKIGANESYIFYQLPLDRMICVIPTNQIRYHINIYNPESSPNGLANNIPNTLPKVDLIK
jgi:hypothetical protein